MASISLPSGIDSFAPSVRNLPFPSRMRTVPVPTFARHHRLSDHRHRALRDLGPTCCCAGAATVNVAGALNPVLPAVSLWLRLGGVGARAQSAGGLDRPAVPERVVVSVWTGRRRRATGDTRR